MDIYCSLCLPGKKGASSETGWGRFEANAMVCCGNCCVRMLRVLEHDGHPRGDWGQSERRNAVRMVTTETEIHLIQAAPEPHMILRTSAKFLCAFVFLSLLMLTTTDFFCLNSVLC